MVHCNTYTPATLTVAVVLDTVASPKVTVPGPLTLLHTPVPTTTGFPPSVATRLHTSWSPPALATVGAASYVTCTVSLEAGHTPLLIVHCNTYTPATLAVA